MPTGKLWHGHHEVVRDAIGYLFGIVLVRIIKDLHPNLDEKVLIGRDLQIAQTVLELAVHGHLELVLCGGCLENLLLIWVGRIIRCLHNLLGLRGCHLLV